MTGISLGWPWSLHKCSWVYWENPFLKKTAFLNHLFLLKFLILYKIFHNIMKSLFSITFCMRDFNLWLYLFLLNILEIHNRWKLLHVENHVPLKPKPQQIFPLVIDNSEMHHIIVIRIVYSSLDIGCNKFRPLLKKSSTLFAYVGYVLIVFCSLIALPPFHPSKSLSNPTDIDMRIYSILPMSIQYSRISFFYL